MPSGNTGEHPEERKEKRKMKVKEIFADTRYNMAITYLVYCMGTMEVFTNKAKLMNHWGEEEATVRFLNTRELQIVIQ